MTMGTFRSSLLLAFALAALLVAGCATGPTTGTVAVSVSGLPVGVAPSLTFAGPQTVDVAQGGSVQLSPGTYAVSVDSVLGGGDLVRALFDGTASATSIVVTAGATSNVDVTYAPRAGTPRIWMGSSPSAYEPGPWSASGTVTPSLSLDDPGTTEDIVFSPDGDLYVGTFGGDVVRYAAEDLDTPGAAAAGTVSLPSSAVGLAWHDGRLYVMLFGSQQLVRFDDPSAIVGTDAVAPDATISVTGYSGTGASAALAFDDQGRLWLAFTSALVRIDDPASPAGSVSVTPDAALTQAASENRLALAYAGGALLTADCGSSSIQRYDGVDAASGTSATAPSATIDVGLSCPVWVGQDASDRFWIANNSGDVGRFSDLLGAGDGSVLVAAVTMDTAFSIDGGGLAFQVTDLP
jgi:sugar lactone lactonase YvrE